MSRDKLSIVFSPFRCSWCWCIFPLQMLYRTWSSSGFQCCKHRVHNIFVIKLKQTLRFISGCIWTWHVFFVGCWDHKGEQSEVWAWQEDWNDQGTHYLLKVSQPGCLLFNIISIEFDKFKKLMQLIFWQSLSLGWQGAILIGGVPAQLRFHTANAVRRWGSNGCAGPDAGEHGAIEFFLFI